MEQYFNSVFDRHSDQLYRFGYSRTSDNEVARDLVQDTFMRLWDALCAGQEMTNVRAWLYLTLRRLIIDYYRKHKTDSLDAIAEEGVQFTSSFSEEIKARAEVGIVLDAINKLDPDDREVITMRYVDGLPPREIAEILDETPNVISVRLNRAAKRLKKLYNHET